MAKTEHTIDQLTVNWLTYKQFRALQQTQSINKDQIYMISDWNEMTKDEVEALLNQKISDATSGMLTEITWANIKNKPNMADYATLAKVRELIDALIGQAPGTLDTLKEIANALGNDPNFATTMTKLIADKQSKQKAQEMKSELEGKIAQKSSVKIVLWGE